MTAPTCEIVCACGDIGANPCERCVYEATIGTKPGLIGSAMRDVLTVLGAESADKAMRDERLARIEAETDFCVVEYVRADSSDLAHMGPQSVEHWADDWSEAPGAPEVGR